MSAQAGRSIDARGSSSGPGVALARPAREPIERMFGHEDEHYGFFYAACAAAFAIHLGLIGFAMAGEMLKDLRAAVSENRARVHEFFWRQYDIEVPPPQKVAEKAPEPPPEPDPVPPPPAPAPKLPAPKDDDPYKNLPAAPTPAKAAAVLVQKENPDEPRDLTANTIVNGDGSATYGQQSAAGTGDKPTMATRTSITGVPGGRGTASAAPPPPPGPDLARNIGLIGSTAWNCPFPAEADSEQIDQAVVTVQVTVRPDGSALSASVVSGGEHGFGRNAKACAMARRYSPALDHGGAAIVSSAPVIVRFSR